MLNLLGEYTCKVDAKGRLSFPARLRKQLDGVLHHGLVLNRDIFEGCLVLYPQPEWDKVNAEMSRLSRYNRKHQLFQRKFMKGATHVELDGAARISIPAALLAHAGIDLAEGNEVVVSGIGEKIEIWSKARYDEQVLSDGDDFDFGDLAEEVRRDLEPGNDDKA
jgi:MraZ protein